MSTISVPDSRPRAPAPERRPFVTTSGLLLAAAGLPLLLVARVFGGVPELDTAWAYAFAAVAAGLFVASGILLPRRPRAGRIVSTFAMLATLPIILRPMLGSPAATLAVLLVVSGVLGHAWYSGPSVDAPPPSRSPLVEGRTVGLALGALVLWAGAVVSPAPPIPSLLATFGVGLPLGSAAVAGIVWLLRRFREYPRRASALGAAAVLAALLVARPEAPAFARLTGLALLAAGVAALVPRTHRARDDWRSFGELWIGHPERLFVGTFFILCLLGTVVLALPRAAADGRSIGLLDAAFTGVSAVCVTGLAVRDTPVAFGGFGQAAILALIQLGGLGIMTFSTVLFRLLGRRISLRHEAAVASLVSPDDRSRVFSATQQLLLFTFACEAVGAILLFLAFRGGGETAGPAAWRATFTAVSAFCNAGFALQSDSLVGYQSHPVVLHVVATLIILGSLSPAVVLGLPRFFRRRGRPVPLQAKLALTGTAVLLGGAFLAILAFEWSQSLGGLGFWDRLHNAWFQSVTLRTAGFNSIDFTAVRSATLSVMMLCMFIGGAPGGTAGGIKVTTAAVLLLLVAHGIRGGFRVTVFGRRIPASVVSRATVVTALGALSVLGATIALLLTQSMPTRDALFEIVSALGTVGLSTGGTAQLDGVGKLIVLSCMFAGRVGPLTLLLFLHQRTPPVQVERPEEEVQVG